MLLNIDVRTTAYPKKWQRKLTARPRTSKRWERQNANAAADPIVDIYTRRCNAIRSEKSRGTIPDEFAAKALEIAKEYKLIAQDDEEYANKQYSRNMQKNNLYTETDKRLK